ncbi:MAG: YdeI/OmpD-associated family protein [Acidobacteria bacterium]|nr:YdeI/OmpD-associated family protein [Acidobacteriota bacterium]
MRTFKNAVLFRGWLAKNGSIKDELTVRLFKKHAAGQGMTYQEALDQALCAGWIDGVRRAHDDDSFIVRFTPRRPRSIWSAINLKRYQELMAHGRVTARGEAAWCDRHTESEVRHSFETKTGGLPPEFLEAFRKHPAAWTYYQRTPPGYRRTSTHWVMSAKRDVTRRCRLQIVIDSSAAWQYIPSMRK